MRFSGQVAVVTGGALGIGGGISKRLAAAGAHVDGIEISGPCSKVVIRDTIVDYPKGFTWDTQSREKDSKCARDGWSLVQRHLADPELKFLLLDELNIVLSYQYLPAAEVIESLRNKRDDLHVVVTGRGALPALIELADLVTEMKEIKHPFKQGIRAQPGIEF